MAWTIENVSKLIEEIEARPILWNVFLDEYKDRNKKSAAWREVGQALNKEVSEVEKKFKTLRTQYAAELKQIETKKSGSAAPSEPTSKWAHFKAMSFLQRGTKRRKGTSTEIGDESKDDDELKSQVSQSEDYDSNLVEVEPAKKSKDKKTKQHAESKNQDDLLQEAMKVLREPLPAQDPYEIFSQYVAGELRGFTSEHIRKRVKREITTAILKGQELEEQMSTARSGASSPASWTSSVLLPINSVGFAAPSPMSQTESQSQDISTGTYSQVGYGLNRDQTSQYML